MLANTPLSSNLFNAIICESGGIFYPGDPQKDRNWTDIYSIKEAEKIGTFHFSSILGSNNVTAQQLRDLPVEKIVSFLNREKNIFSSLKENGSKPKDFYGILF